MADTNRKSSFTSSSPGDFIRVRRKPHEKPKPRVKVKLYKVDNPDVAKFLHGETKVKTQKPLPDPRKYDVDPFADNPLLKFRLSAGRTKKVYQFLEEQAVRNKIQTFKTRPKVRKVERLPRNQLECHKLLREYSEQQPTVPLQDTWIKSIQDKLHGLHVKFPVVAAGLLDEIRANFVEEMHKFGVSLVVKPLPGEEVLPRRMERLAGGKTSRYPVYLRHRRVIKTNLHIFHPIQREIFMAAIVTLPKTLTDFDKYRSLGYLKLEILKDMILTDIKKAEHSVTTSYYAEVVKFLDKKFLKSINPKVKPRFLSSATNILRIQVTDLMYRSIEHVLWLTEQEQRMPYFDLSLICDDGIVLSPNQEEIYGAFHEIIDNLANIAQKLTPLETWVDDVPIPKQNITISLNQMFLDESHKKLQKNLEALMLGVNSYIAELETQHEFLYSKKIFHDLTEFIATGPSFESLVDKRQDFEKYRSELGFIISYEYFGVFRVCQNDFIDNLKKLADVFCDELHMELFRIHSKENLDICSTFQELKYKALKDPETTEELLDMGVFMLGASSAIVEALEDRIAQQLSKAALLIDLTEVPYEHIRLMSDTVNWITDIKPVFELNSSQYEQHKFEFEERLQKRQEMLTTDIEELGPRLVVLNHMDDTNRIPEYIQEIRKFLGILDNLDKDVLWINHEESLFKFPLSTYQELDELHGFLNPFAKLLFMTDRWQWKHRVWMNGSFQDLDANVVEATTEEFFKDFMETQKMFKAKIKQQIQDNVARRFKGNVDDPDPNNVPVPIKICAKTIEQIKNFKMHVPLVKILCNNALMQRHWDEMSLICGFDITPDYGSTLSKVVQMDIQSYLDQFEVISIGACKEQQLGENLRLMWSEWKNVKFILSTWKDTDLLILSELDDIQSLLDDHLVKTLTMRGSAFVKPFEGQVKDWYNTLDRVNKTIDEWGKVQVQWLYFLPIFSSKDICQQMLEESTMFREVDSTFRKIMLATNASPYVIDTAGAPGLYERFTNLQLLLEKINHGVNEYLEKKRLYFPRFFFLSNDEMLEILSEIQDPLKVEPHLRKCFEGIAKLDFTKNLDIISMISSEGEIVKFLEKVSTKSAGGSVEKWLKEVETQMVVSVRDTMLKAFAGYAKESDRKLWVQIWPAQIVLAVSSIYWTADVHHVLRAGNLENLGKFFERLKVQLEETVGMVRGTLPKLTRLTLGSLIVIDVHAKDIVGDLYARKLRSDTEFGWLAQLRYYMEDEDCVVRMINATIRYAYEYLGNTPRLVITPLTDRCYRTLIGAYCLHLNGAPEGPAGTGKTETTKDLAKALAVQCIVFNCSDGLDYKAMGKFFKGLASAGAWACFDEFNRIELEVLSVVAQQILLIMRAVQSGAEKFLFEGTELTLNPACYVCITMNPGYAGRSELPDNLKVLFRTVAMMVPDYALIAEISLYSYGFIQARSLSVKIVTTYRLCSEQLSTQSHYDYGMRAVKTVLTAAGQLKIQHPDVDELVLMHRALVDVNKSKLLDQDIDLFDGIVSDMFPEISPMVPDYSDFFRAMGVVCQRDNLQMVDYFRNKLVQVFEMLNVRHGVMLVGEPFGGKSSVLRTLAAGLEILGERVVSRLVNPKSLTMGQLYGQCDPVSAEWSDGVLPLIFRFFIREEGADWKWLVLDGPVDAIWVENLNTVLDDNKKLCLSSGEVMVMPENMRLIFEVGDLLQASPATVSRCGMIYFEPRALGYEVLIDSWITENTWMHEHKEVFQQLVLWIIPACLAFIRKNCGMVVELIDSQMVASMLCIIRMVLLDAMKNPPPHYLAPWLQAAVVYAGLWGLAGALDQNYRTTFNEFYLELLRGNDEEHPIPIGKIEISLPLEGCLFDFVYSFKAKGNWRAITDILKQEKVDEPGNLSQMLVPTVDTVKYGNLIDIHVNHHSAMVLVGRTGTGKTFLTQHYLMTKITPPLIPAFVSFTPSTSANETQKLIMSKLFKRKKDVYGPPVGQKCVLFIDDLNMSGMEDNGAQPAVELLRQFFDTGFWYDLRDKTTLYLKDILVLSAMGLPGGGRHHLPKRFLRHLNVLFVNDASDESMSRIFSTLLFTAFKRNGFASDSITAVTSIVNATSDVYTNCLTELLPTPKKSHYLFNLRDFARVIKGCGLIKKESVDSRKVYAKLWVHEALRVFYDRLTDKMDQSWFVDKLSKCVREHFKENFDEVFGNLRLEDGICTENSLRELMFGCVLDLDAQDGDRKYEEVTMDQLLDVASTVMEEYNTSHNTKIDLVLFRYALEHVSRICRILLLGNGLLIGVSGVGRQSLTRLASAIMGYNFFQPEITASYSFTEWRNDLKKILKEAGGRSKSTAFLLTDAQIREQSFLSDIDSLLNLGEVPELFSIDEQQEILELVRLAAQGGNRNLDISPLTVFNFFINRCKQKLHIVLCFSPIGSEFRDRLRIYSSLVNCCTIDWFFDWPVEALELIGVKFMSGVGLDDTVKGNIVTAGKLFHESAKKLSEDYLQRVTYVTNSSFIELMTSFARLIGITQEETQAAKSKYITGLEKLDFAANQVSAISKELSELQPKLVDAKSQTVDMMVRIEEEKKKVEAIAFLVKQDEKIANEQAASSMALKAECEADLAQAIPILEEAIAALNTLKPADITLVKSMKNPPDAVKLVMAAVCVMKDVKPDRQNDPTTGRKVLDYWGPSKRILGDMAFLQQLKEYDKDNIHPEIMVKIRKEYIPHKDFKPNVVAKASSAAEGLCKWVIAMDLYDAVAKEVAPKKAKLEVAEKALAATMVLLNAKRSEAMKLEERLMELMGKLQETQEKKQQLEDEVTLCANKLSRAEKLIDGLGGEKTRWESSAKQLEDNYQAIAGDILISCGVIAYLGPFGHDLRMERVHHWHETCQMLDIPCSGVYSLRGILGSDVKIQNWEIFGLPSDAFSVDNAIILDVSTKWPLLIDPQNQANKWIRNMEKGNNLEIIKLTDPGYMKIIVDCITYGKPVLIENILETLDPALDPILLKNVFKQFNKFFISLRDDVIEYNPNFKLYLTSNLRNGHYPPEICNKVRVIDFSLTVEGLEEQLLNLTVAKERPDLQKKRQELIVKSAENKKALLEVEAMILQTLSSSKGNILEDESAIDTLDAAKHLSERIKIEQESTVKTERVIESFRMSYRPIAAHSAVLYYCVADLVRVDPMYQYSLVWFVNLFTTSVDSANKSKVLEKRLRFLIDTFTYNLYANITRSLFEKDKILFSFILCAYVMIAEGRLTQDELTFFLTGGSYVQTVNLPSPANWLKSKTWCQICALGSLPNFHDFLQSFVEDIHVYEEFSNTSEPKITELSQQLSSFQRLVLVSILRPEAVVPNIGLFVDLEMGEKFTKPPSFDLNASYNDSNCFCPLVFVLSPGSDPMNALANFAHKLGTDLETVSLGQGQGPLAARLIAEAQSQGSWICLQNCHLAASWMPTLEKIWESMDSVNTRLEFRLWLTSYPSNDFPTALLQNSVKMTKESPKGLQQNVLKSFTSEPVCDPVFFSGCPGKNATFGKLLYGLTFFHAVVQERKKFGPIGWNIPYGFDESDYQISVKQLMTFISDYSDTPYEAIVYLTGECNYGGRVTDEWDRRTLMTILEEFLNKLVVDSPTYRFADGDWFGLPRKTGYSDYVNHVKHLPRDPSPTVFGLHPNAGIVQGLRSTKELLASALAVQGAGFQTSSKSDTTFLQDICKQILDSLPKDFDIEAAFVKFPVSYQESMNALLLQELQQFNNLMNVIRNSLKSLQKALIGLTVMTPRLDELALDLQLAKLPKIWSKFSYPSLKPLASYITDLHKRLHFFTTWLETGKPSRFWISGFYSVHGLLTGVLQNFARKYTIPIDQLTFDFKVDDELDSVDDGALIWGLFLEGARWHDGQLAESLPKQLYDDLPVVWIQPIRKGELMVRGRYVCPLYKTLERRGTLSTTGISTNFVFAMMLDTVLLSEHWVKRGVALFCQLDD